MVVRTEIFCQIPQTWLQEDSNLQPFGAIEQSKPKTLPGPSVVYSCLSGVLTSWIRFVQDAASAFWHWPPLTWASQRGLSPFSRALYPNKLLLLSSSFSYLLCLSGYRLIFVVFSRTISPWVSRVGASHCLGSGHLVTHHLRLLVGSPSGRIVKVVEVELPEITQNR